MPDRPLNEEKLRRSLRSRPLTFAQRRKHLDRLERSIAAEEAEMESMRRRSNTELAVMVGGIAAVVIGFVVWTIVLNISDSADEPDDPLALAQATLTAGELALEPATVTPSTATIHPSPTPIPAASGPICPADPFEERLGVGVPFNGQLYPDWYTNEDRQLWAGPRHFGSFIPTGFPHPSSVWFADGQMTISWYGTSTPIILTGEQINGDAELGPIKPISSSSQLQWTDLTIPEPGCWTLVGTAGDEMIEITVEVLPLHQRPDIILIQNYYDARPYEAPASCAISPWTGPAIRATTPWTDSDFRSGSSYAHYWLEDGGIAAEVPGLFIAQRDQHMGILGKDVTEGLEVNARMLGVPISESFSATAAIWNTDARLASFVFPSPGCWELEMTTPTLNATFVVYVYPLECEPVVRDEEYVSDCEAP